MLESSEAHGISDPSSSPLDEWAGGRGASQRWEQDPDEARVGDQAGSGLQGAVPSSCAPRLLGPWLLGLTL